LCLGIFPLVGGVDEAADLRRAGIVSDVENIYLTDTRHLHFLLEIGLPAFVGFCGFWPFCSLPGGMSLVMTPIEPAFRLSPISLNGTYAGKFFFGEAESFCHSRASHGCSPAGMFLLDAKEGEGDHVGEDAHGTSSLFSPIWWIECLPPTIMVTRSPEANALKRPPTLFGHFLKGIGGQFEVNEVFLSATGVRLWLIELPSFPHLEFR